MDLKDKVAVITGASSGIGKATAKDLRSAGMKLVITARREDRLRELADGLSETEILAGDIVEPSMSQALIEKAVDAFGRCDVVVNNAGFGEINPIDKIDIDRVCEMVRVNVEAAFRLAHLAVRHFLAQGGGHLVNVSSVLGTKVRPTTGAYAGTKYAIEALSESMRHEVAGTGVRVSCVEPGIVLTEFHDHWEVHPTKSMNVPNPLQPEDIARCIRFVLEQPEHVSVARMLVLPSEHKI
jgi:NADP-dependent 3-hydroxy acid dehydrogenase YdfG